MTRFRIGLASFRRLQNRLRSASACPTCGKSTAVFNAGETMIFRAESVTAATHCTCPGGIVELTQATKRHARFDMLHSDNQSVTIRDEGPWSFHRTVTNDAEWVVASMLSIVGKRRLFYVDSDGKLDELLIKRGRFAGFKPGPTDPAEITRLTRC